MMLLSSNSLRLLCAFGLILAATTHEVCLSQDGNQKNVSDLGTGIRSVQIARFHSLWLVANDVTDDKGSKAIGQLKSLFTRFNESFFVHVPNAKEVGVVEIVPTPATGIEDETWNVVGKKRDLENHFKVLDDNLAATIGTMRDNQDVVFVYVLAHGRNEEKEGVVLTLGGEDVNCEKEIVNRLIDIQKRRNVRLVVLITDNCQTIMTDNRQTKGATESTRSNADSESASASKKIAGIWRSLYFGHKGFVHVSSTKPGEPGDLDNGVSRFLKGFAQSFENESLGLNDPNLSGEELAKAFVSKIESKYEPTVKDGFVTWDEFMLHLQKQMKNTDEQMKNNVPKQTPSFVNNRHGEPFQR